MNNTYTGLSPEHLDEFITDTEIIDHIYHAVFVINLEGRVVYWNKSGEELFGYRKEEIIGEKISLLYQADKESHYEIYINNVLEKEEEKKEWLARHKDGSLIWVDLKSGLLKNNEGITVGIIGSACDISSQKNLEEEIKDSNAHAKAILETMVNGVISIDANGNILTFNKAAEKIFGYSKEEITGRNVNVLMPYPHQEKHDKYIKDYLNGGPQNVIGIGREVRGKRKDGSAFPMELAVSEVNADNEKIFIGIISDISDRRELEKEIVQISDNERRRIGRDLHDGLGQMLTGIGLMGQNLVRKMTANGIPGTEKLKEIIDMVKEADQYSRNLSHNLIPIELDSEGLKAALVQMCARVENLYGLNCKFIEKGQTDLEGQDSSFHLYRICQEAINNAVKHGKASCIEVSLEGSINSIKLRIVDNGIGFKVEDQDKNDDGMGINIMRHRAQLSGGELTIGETEDGKTCVECHIRYH